MSNNAALKAAGKTPVIQSYGDTWTSQIFVLADFFNVYRERSRLGDEVHEQPSEVRG